MAFDVNEYIDMREDYFAQLYDEGKLTDEQYNYLIDELEELRE